MNPDSTPHDLKFNSTFESGNLDMVAQVGLAEYDLFLRNDTNTRGHNSWFHFCVEVPTPRTVRFNIQNMTKPDMLYTRGMQVYTWSRICNAISHCGWEASGYNIKCWRHPRAGKHDPARRWTCLTFDIEFTQADDMVWFAYTIPYTYSMLLQFKNQILLRQKEQNRKIFEEMPLCRSLSGLDVPLYTITDHSVAPSHKQVVLVQSRIHPGETSASWITHGFITFLTGKSRMAKETLKRFIFKIIPMVNPDGVVAGNHRTSVIGKDINRQYLQQNDDDPRLTPIPVAITQLLS